MHVCFTRKVEKHLIIGYNEIHKYYILFSISDYTALLR